MGARPVFIVGTRAQLIKVAPVLVRSWELGQDPLLLFTGQHRETMDDLVQEFDVRAEQRHAVGGGERSTVGGLLAWLPRAAIGIFRALRTCRGESGTVHAVVHGDTLSTLIGALACRIAGGKVFHLESGLSSGKLFDPFPEELTRRLVFRLAHVALCPGDDTATYMRTHHRRCRVVDTGGNTILDSVMLATRAGKVPHAPPRSYVVASLHRFQNIFDRRRFLELVSMIEALAAAMPVHFVLHPATRKRLEAEGLFQRLSALPDLNLSPRLGYADFLSLAANAACVLTDGGSNQEELAALGVPTLVMRRHTEREDGLGANAMMEADVPGGPMQFVLSGAVASLRRPATVAAAFGPSDVAARALV